jgi:hypothetical protein
MDLSFIPTPDGRTKLRGVSCGLTDAQAYAKALPDPLPPGHAMMLTWSTNERGQRCFELECLPQALAEGARPDAKTARLEELLKMANADLQDLAPRVGIMDAAAVLKKQGGKRMLCARIVEEETKEPTL